VNDNFIHDSACILAHVASHLEDRHHLLALVQGTADFESRAASTSMPACRASPVIYSSRRERLKPARSETS